MTIAGCDYAWTKPSVAALKAAGISFVSRYLSTDASKDLTAAEVSELHAAGFSIVVNWETSGTTFTGGYQAGLTDAHAARAEADALGVPADVPVYYSVDSQTTDITTVLDYLHGLADAEGSKAKVGVYGDFLVCQAAAGAGFTFLWQTYAWSNGEWEPAAVLRQVSNDQSIGGVSVDLDEAMVSAYGQWAPSGVPSPPSPPKPPAAPAQITQGATGTEVERLQRSLMLAGQRPGNIDGNFGIHTLAATRAFQQAYRLTVDGQVGPKTWGALMARTGAVQAHLNEHGAKLTVDLDAGPLTANAVTTFQSSRHLYVDGIVGPETSGALGLVA